METTINKYNVGEKLVCVKIEPLNDNKIAPPLTLGETYKVDTICLDKEGNQHLNVGLKSKVEFIRSIETGEALPDGDKIHWCHPSRFKLHIGHGG
jgi:hypothetical protein